jgi:hypothetical protein
MLLVHDAKEGDESIRTGVLFRGVGDKSSRPSVTSTRSGAPWQDAKVAALNCSAALSH